MSNASYIQWCNENAGRAYPLAETASRRDNAGHVMPDNILLDMSLLVPPVHAGCYISSMRVTPQTVSFGISSTVSGLFVFTASWRDLLVSNLSDWTSYPLTPVVSDVSGWVVLNRLESNMLGNWKFGSYAQSGIEGRALRVVDTLPIRSILRKDMNPMLYFGGVVKLQAGAGVTVTQDSLNPQKIIVKLTADAKKAMLGPCDEQANVEVCGVPPLRSINGVCPDANGKITLRFE